MDRKEDQLASLFPSIAAQMRGALGNLHLAAYRLIPPEAREADPDLDARAAVLDQSYYQLLRLVNNLTAARYLLDDTPLPMQNRDIAAFVEDLCQQAGDAAKLLGITVGFSSPVERHVCAIHPPSLEQLLYHLLSNALKFTPKGGSVTVELRISGGRILISVTDTGCGISPEKIETLFERYLHPEALSQGLGMGLPLCRRIAELHGGTLMAESFPGKGSRFTLSLPDRLWEGQVSDVAPVYTGGFNRTLLGLADALPSRAFLIRTQD